MTKHHKIKLIVDIESQQEPGHVHRAGASGIVVEPLGPSAWLVEVRVPDPTLEGDAWYETIEVRGDEFELIAEHWVPSPALGAQPLLGRENLSAPWSGEVRGLEPPPMPEADRLAV